MPQILWSQDYFAKGELSPLLYSRITLQAYYQGLKRAKNVICFPQGTAGKRFGTRFLTEVLDTNIASLIYFKSFQYLNECCYLVLFRSEFVDIYLEGQRIASIASPISGDEVNLIDHTVLENRFRVTTGIYAPYDLTRASDTANAITAFDGTENTLTITTPITSDIVLPARFTTSTDLPATNPQIHLSRTYFIRALTTTTIRIYDSAEDAAANIDYFTITSSGTGANLITLNNWTFAAVTFQNLPVFDFDGGYDTSSFTPSATTGYGITITRSAGTFNFIAAFVGGVFVGNGATCRITATNGTNIATIDVVDGVFANTTAIPGTQVFIAEPAWSATRLWPRKCSSFQNRAFFANTDNLTNGLWGSVTNDFDDFDGTDPSDPTKSISWFPSSDTVNYIEFIVPYRSLTIHTNSGIYSTPLSVETAITPTNFSMSLQDSHPAKNVQPAGIDNQIIALSGNDAHSLLWDGYNNAYTSNIISISNEQLIRDPVDQAPYADLIRAGSRYMFIINSDGTLAVYQTLLTENVSGFTEAVLEQSYGNAYFRWVTSNFDGRAWFITEREIATADGPYNITAYSSTTLTNNTFIFSTSEPTPITFQSGTLPTSSPQVETGVNYWAIGVGAEEFTLYLNQEDATALENAIEFSDAGSSATILAYPLENVLFIEQLDFDAYMDCTGYYPEPTTAFPVPGVSTISGQSRFNAQSILMQGDGFGFETKGVDGNVDFIAHGSPVLVTDAQYGFPINVEITPLPISLSVTGNPKNSNLVETKHLRYATFLFADTIGGTITQSGLTFPVALSTLSQITPGLPPEPKTGSFEISVMNAWDDFNIDNFTINHTEPYGLKLTGIFYTVDTD